MNVDLDTLEQAIETIFDHLRSKGIVSLDINEDYYWNIPEEEVYNPLMSPSALDLGQLSDNWKDLKAIALGESPAIGYALLWAAPLLRRIAEQNVS